MAVCLLPGTELAFEHEVEYDGPLGFLPSRRLAEKVARFRQINTGQPDVHHDALEFPSGQTLLLTRLREGQRLTVLQLPVTPQTKEAEERQRSSFVA